MLNILLLLHFMGKNKTYLKLSGHAKKFYLPNITNNILTNKSRSDKADNLWLRCQTRTLYLLQKRSQNGKKMLGTNNFYFSHTVISKLKAFADDKLYMWLK